MKSVINRIFVDTTRQPIFCGEGLSIQRYDKFKYESFMQSWMTQISFFWRPEEFELNKDRADYAQLDDHEQFIFTSNLKYQTLLDSVQSRGIPLLASKVTIPELEAAMSAWQFFETLHSYSYTYIIKNVYPDPSHVFDSILHDQAIIDRAESVTRDYDNLIDAADDEREKLYLALISVNILEGIRFYVSFVCSYAFAENKKMEGNAKIIKLINRDENLHLALTQNILKYLRTKSDEGFVDVINKCNDKVVSMYEHAASEEKEWAKYLFSRGSILGLNDKVLCDYVEWLTNQRLKGIGLNPIFDRSSKCPLSWMQNWTGSKSVQVAPQETEVENYRVGQFSSDLKNSDFSDML